MGRIKYQADIKNLFEKSPVVTSRDIKLFVKKKYRYVLVANLIKKNKIKRIVKGFYTIHEDPVLSAYCFRPCYIGLQEALSIHKIWEQETATVIVTSKKIKKSSIKIFGNNILVHRINAKYMFGFDVVKYGDFFVPVSDLEKTFIDLVYFNEAIDRKVISAMRKKIDKKKLNGYLKNYPKILRTRVERLLG